MRAAPSYAPERADSREGFLRVKAVSCATGELPAQSEVGLSGGAGTCVSFALLEQCKEPLTFGSCCECSLTGISKPGAS